VNLTLLYDGAIEYVKGDQSFNILCSAIIVIILVDLILIVLTNPVPPNELLLDFRSDVTYIHIVSPSL